MCSGALRFAPVGLAVLASIGCTVRGAEADGGTLLVVDANGLLADDAARGDGATPDARPIDGGPILSDVLIYAHSRDTLYTFSPFTTTVTEIAAFTLEGGEPAPYMLDLAVNAEFGIGSEQLFALVFLPAGALGPSETLLGATNEGVYYEVDVRDASTSRVGRYPEPWSSSGDIVSVEGLGTFATIREPERSDTDFLAQITFAGDGSSTVRVLGEVGYREVFGLGWWGRALYGFTNSGQLLEIDRLTGEGRIATTETGTDQFWGAGVTTRAPILF
jgi:hypothetical protein